MEMVFFLPVDKGDFLFSWVLEMDARANSRAIAIFFALFDLDGVSCGSGDLNVSNGRFGSQPNIIQNGESPKEEWNPALRK